MHDASHRPETVREEPAIRPAHRRATNDWLRRERPGHICAVLYPNAETPGAEKPRHRVTVVKLQRGSSGKPPRRGVQIPLDSFAAVKANTRIHGRAVQGPRHQPARAKRK